MINLVSGCCEKPFIQKSKLDGQRYPQACDNKIHDPQQVLWCNRTQLKLESHWFLRQQISTLYQEKYNIHTKIIYISSFKNRLSSPFCPTGFYFKSKIVESSRKMQNWMCNIHVFQVFYPLCNEDMVLLWYQK